VTKTTKTYEAFQFACYNAVQAIGEPATVKMIALKLGKISDEPAIRKMLNTLCKQKALSKKQIGAIWHYFI
jgi:Ca2+-binding EF-hand superfamily protein